MAQKRMFDLQVINQDSFLDLPMEAKAIYFLLGMEADDEGFISPKKILRLYGGTEDSVKILIAKGFLIPFESGVVVITDWAKNNWLDKRRTKETIYQKEKEQLTYDNKLNKYLLNNGLANAEQPLRQSSIEENRVEENRVEENNNISTDLFTSEQVNAYSMILNDKSFYTPNENEIQNYKNYYPSVDIEQELRNMASWCMANQQKRKTKRGIKTFINNWLSRKQNNSNGNKVIEQHNEPKDDLDALLEEHCN